MVENSLKSKRRSFTLISIIIAGETVFLLPFVVARIFRPTLLTVFEISNTELGLYFSIYGIVAMVSYYFGGILADRFPSRKLMALALWLTSFGGFIMDFIPSSGMMKLIYGFYGFTTIFLFWAAMIRATREWGGSGFQSRAFGWLEGGRGATAALLGTLSFLLFSYSSNENTITIMDGDNFHPFQYVLFSISAFTFLIGILIWFVVPDNSQQVKKTETLFVRGKVLLLLRLPKMWMLAVMIVCAYTGYKITDDYSLFARELLGFSEVNAAGIGTAALWMRAVVAIASGIAADRLNKIKIISFGFGLAVLGGLLVGLGIFNQSLALLLINLVLTMVGVYAVRALYFAILNEVKIPLKLTGTAVGIVSLVGFTPDIFMSPWMGHLLDKYPGPTGHQYVFLVLASFAFVGFLTSLVFRFSGEKEIQAV